MVVVTLVVFKIRLQLDLINNVLKIQQMAVELINNFLYTNCFQARLSCDYPNKHNSILFIKNIAV